MISALIRSSSLFNVQPLPADQFRELSGAVAVDIVASGNVWIRVYDSNGNATGISITQQQWADLKRVAPIE